MLKFKGKSLFLSLILLLIFAVPASVYADEGVYIAPDYVDVSGGEVLASYVLPVILNEETNEVTIQSPKDENVASRAPLKDGIHVADVNVTVIKQGNYIYGDFKITTISIYGGILSYAFDAAWSNGFNDPVTGFGGGLKTVLDQSQTTFNTAGAHTLNVWGWTLLTTGYNATMDEPLILPFTTD
ncbi:hypothetical protein GCM10010912_29970 [Paenibacillus albidus]|uniref:DUF4879 domain-containing protein n=1 Tax=Paenibacillus albidus TaxID=2041023 RepID=A0A917CEP5_9BACL|nr:hypothetical protein [Paenibacillus albidus]GGF82882.1 hypothetical protein GCM10010912_29970 [Paenibacillus albidus]